MVEERANGRSKVSLNVVSRLVMEVPRWREPCESDAPRAMEAGLGAPGGVGGYGSDWELKGEENKEVTEISGSNKKPETHMRATASRLKIGQGVSRHDKEKKRRT